MIDQRWSTINGREWIVSAGNMQAIVCLMPDETTYKTNLWWLNGDSAFLGDFDCLRKAKAACMEELEDAEDLADAISVLSNHDDLIISEMEL